MMRTVTLTALLVALLASPVWATGGGHGGNGSNNYTKTTLKVVNDCDHAVVVSANGGSPITLEPNGSQDLSFLTYKGLDAITVALTATIEGTSNSDTESATIRAGNRATATITCPTSTSLAIAFSGGGLAKVVFSRDAGVSLASAGAFLPLWWLASLLGCPSRRRRSDDAKPSTDEPEGCDLD
jgi:hypothetical protein